MGFRHDERGAVLVVGAAGIAAILIVAALIVDLGSARADRAENQVVTDSAAAAGVVGMVSGSGAAGCEAAVAYTEVHLGSVDGLDCSGFPVTCNDFTDSVTASGVADGRTISITHPVDDADPLMGAGSYNAPAQVVGTVDGGRCDRLGVSIVNPRQSFFAAVLRQDAGSTSAHTVARVSDEFGRNLIINLLLLEDTDCEALSVGGGGSAGGIFVGSVTDPETGDVYPGRIALDSDGQGAGCHSRGTIHVNGSGATIRADGAPGCADELEPLGFGYGCGRLETYAPGTPGCNLPACSSGGTIAPAPVQVPRRLTRSPIDWQYNCKSDYPASFEIRGCSDAATRNPYIDQLVDSVLNYTYFTSYQSAGFKCNINGNGDPVVVPVGNWYVDCGDLRVGRELTFEGGNIIFEGDVSLGAQGHLRINSENPTYYGWTEGSPLNFEQHSEFASFVYFLDGTLAKAGGASLEMNDTMVYLSATSELKLSGGSGAMVWAAPREGPFANLALWSESALDHDFSGSATLVLEGIFFTPKARIIYTGNGGQATVEAQFVARAASAQGNGSLGLKPKWDRAIKHPPPGISELIR